MSKRKFPLKISGKTTNQKIVVTGVFRTYETFGVGLDELLDTLYQKGIIVDWISFYNEALSAGMKHAGILSKLEPSISDTYGSQYCKVILSRLESLKE